MTKALPVLLCVLLAASSVAPLASSGGGSTPEALPDADGDGIPDDRERSLGLDPESPDTDGDGIGDRLELREGGDRYALSGSDPLRKDLYVTVYVLADQHAYRSQHERVLAAVRRAFASMPVENPDGSEGISLHLSVEYVDRTATEVAGAASDTGGRIELADVREAFPTRGPGHAVVVTAQEHVGGHAGEGALAGRTAVVGIASEHVLVHELLHNLVGRELPAGECGAVHTCEGYLSDGRTNALRGAVGRVLEEGFATELVTATGPSRR